MGERVLKMDEVCKKTGISKTEIYRQMAAGKFPAHFKIGKRGTGWVSSEIDQWIENVSAKRLAS